MSPYYISHQPAPSMHSQHYWQDGQDHALGVEHEGGAAYALAIGGEVHAVEAQSSHTLKVSGAGLQGATRETTRRL